MDLDGSTLRVEQPDFGGLLKWMEFHAIFANLRSLRALGTLSLQHQGERTFPLALFGFHVSPQGGALREDIKVSIAEQKPPDKTPRIKGPPDEPVERGVSSGSTSPSPVRYASWAGFKEQKQIQFRCFPISSQSDLPVPWVTADITQEFRAPNSRTECPVDRCPQNRRLNAAQQQSCRDSSTAP